MKKMYMCVRRMEIKNSNTAIILAPDLSEIEEERWISRWAKTLARTPKGKKNIYRSGLDVTNSKLR